MTIDKERVQYLRDWLTDNEGVDDPEDLFDDIDLLVELMDYWLEQNK